MRKEISYCILILLIVSISSVYSQNTSNVKPLREVIATLEKKYHVKFNYDEESLKGITIETQFEDATLDIILEHLEEKTGLTFTKMSSYIVLIHAGKAQVLCGYIKDGATKKPLEAATIKTLHHATTTSETGFFQIPIENGKELVEIRYLGYYTVVKPARFFNGELCESIWLNPKYQKLTEVLISNYIVNGINKINNGSYEIDFADFDILPGLIETDVLQSVQSFPGIQSLNETVSNINIRGGTHDQNLILWDGIKMYQSGHFFGLISMYNPQITQQVSLTKNGSRVALSDGVSGTIDMRTSKQVSKAFKGVLGVNLTNVNGFVDVPLSNKSSIQIAARSSINDLIETPTYKTFFNRISQNTEVDNNETNVTNSNQSFDFYDTSLRWIYNISENDKLRLNFINVYNQLVFDENANIEGEGVTRKSSLSQTSIAGTVNYIRNWNDKLQTELEIYETDYKLKSINANIEDAQRFLQENKVSETSTKLKVNYSLGDRIQLLNGYHFVETEITNLDDVDTPLYRLLVSEVLRAHGVFSEVHYGTLNKATSLTLGLRYNYLEKFKKQLVEPRLSFSQRFLNHFTWDVLAEFKHQNTSQVINFQNDFLGIEKRRWQLSNDSDIPIIKSRQVSLGISYNKKGWLFNIEGYYKRVRGITAQSQGFQNQFEFNKSIGSYTSKGFDVLVRKTVKKLNTWLSYSYMDSDYLFNDLSSSTFPSNFDITHLVTLGTVYKLKQLKLSAGFNWHTGKPATPPVQGSEINNNTINYTKPNSSRLKDYARLDVSALYDFNLLKSAKATIGVSVWNVLNRENEINSYYRINNGSVSEMVQNSLEITPNAMFRVRF